VLAIATVSGVVSEVQIGSETTLSILEKTLDARQRVGRFSFVAYGGDFIRNPFCAPSGMVSMQQMQPPHDLL
jgi:hypothetical protein